MTEVSNQSFEDRIYNGAVAFQEGRLERQKIHSFPENVLRMPPRIGKIWF
jgi:hypothetical protein